MVKTQSTRMLLLNSAIDLFAEKGYDKTSMRDIANISNLSTASIYHHFKDKYDILNEIFNYYKENFFKHRIDIDYLLEFAKSKPIEEILAMSFLNFGENHTQMMKISSLLMSRQYIDEKASKLFNKLFIRGTKIYLHKLFCGLENNHRIIKNDYENIIDLMLGFMMLKFQENIVRKGCCGYSYNIYDISGQIKIITNFISKNIEFNV